MADAKDIFTRTLTDHQQMVGELSALSGPLVRAAEWIVTAYRNGKKVLAFGNGGSAADAQHLTAELVGRFLRERKGLPAIALTANTSTLTSVGNDYGYEQIFARQVEALAVGGDVVIAFSTSGNSQNVLNAVQAANQLGARTVALTGSDGGTLKAAADLCLCVPSEQTPRIQEGHLILMHALCEAVEAELFG